MSVRKELREQTLNLYRRGIQSFGDRHPKPLQYGISHVDVNAIYTAPMTWVEEARVVRFEFRDAKAGPVCVEVRFPKPEGSSVRLSGMCSCSPGQEAVTCKHTLAATQRLRSLLAQSSNPQVEAILRGCDPSPVETLVGAIDTVLRRKIEEQRADQATDEVEEKPSRLSFRVTLLTAMYGKRISVAMYEQTTLKSGNWSKGRQISWQIAREREQLFRSPQEKAAYRLAAASLGWNNRDPFAMSYYYRVANDGPNEWKLLLALAGAGNVFFADNTSVPIEISSGDIGFGAELGEAGLRLSVIIGNEHVPREADCVVDPAHGLLFATDRRLWLTPIEDRELRDLAEEVHDSSIEVPRDQAALVVARLARLSEFTRVNLPQEFQLGEVVADRRTYLELVPGPTAGLIVRLRVRPEEDGALLFPGDRRSGRYVISNEGYRRLLRDHDAELQQANAISGELQLDRWSQITDWDWRITSDEETLDFLARLKDRQTARKQASQSSREAMTPDGSATEVSDALNSAAAPAEVNSLGGLADESATDDLVVLWPKGAKMRVTTEITPSALRIEIEDHNDWFGIHGTIQIDGHQIPLLDLLSAMKSGRQYIALGNGMFARISEEFRKRLRGLQDVAHQDHGRLEVDFTAAPLLNDLFDTQINLKACQAWRDVLKRLDEVRAINPDPPISLTAELRDYQVEGYRWLKRLATWGAGACLADDMGLGKTVQALALLIERMEEGPALVVAPTSVGFNWLRETARFAPSINALAYRDSNRDELLQSVHSGDLVVVSYALLQRDFEKFEQVEWGTLVLDESQAVKNAATKTARAVRDLKAKWRLALTGTPIENHLGELWSLFRVLNPGLFGSWDRFRERFGNPIEKNKDLERRASLSRLVRPFILRRTKDEVLRELPERTEIELNVELSDAERKRYEDARLKILAQLAGLDDTAGKDHRFQVLAGLMQLRQLACHPALQDKKWKKSSAKLDAFLELVEELREEQHRALVFSQFTQHLDLVRKSLDEKGITYQYLDGATPEKQRRQAVDAFQNGEGELFLISLKAGGTGLNLTAADYVIHLDPWWNPAVEDQATDRAHRIGQTKPVTVYRLVTKDTIEEKILALHDRKRELVASILDGTDQAAKLSTDDLIDLIRDGSNSPRRETAKA